LRHETNKVIPNPGSSVANQTSNSRSGVIRSSKQFPICPYPQTAVYNGSGSIDAASSFRCAGDLESQVVVCNDALTRYKHEVRGKLDFDGTGVNARLCRADDRDDDDDKVARD
jgi:hypothetical protein